MSVLPTTRTTCTSSPRPTASMFWTVTSLLLLTSTQ
jgi:hypothetical protein